MYVMGCFSEQGDYIAGGSRGREGKKEKEGSGDYIGTKLVWEARGNKMEKPKEL